MEQTAISIISGVIFALFFGAGYWLGAQSGRDHHGRLPRARAGENDPGPLQRIVAAGGKLFVTEGRRKPKAYSDLRAYESEQEKNAS